MKSCDYEGDRFHTHTEACLSCCSAARWWQHSCSSRCPQLAWSEPRSAWSPWSSPGPHYNKNIVSWIHLKDLKRPAQRWKRKGWSFASCSDYFNTHLKHLNTGRSSGPCVFPSDAHKCGFKRSELGVVAHPSGKKALMIRSPSGFMANSGILWKSSRLQDRNRQATFQMKSKQMWNHCHKIPQISRLWPISKKTWHHDMTSHGNTSHIP